jgi:MoaA/NifB/PqqE/SkfB family radical SAM enzyme
VSNPSTKFSIELVAACKRALSGRGGVQAIAGAAFQRRQALKRLAAERRGETVPAILIASVTRRCNLACSGCYSKALRPEDGAAREELSDDRFMELFEEAVELGVGAILVAGGEPLLRPSLLKRLAALKGVVAPVFTNGSLIDEKASSLFGGRLLPVFSVEGDEAFTTERRGVGVHEAALARARAMRDAGRLFGLSVTVTSRNADYVLSKAFLGEVETLGASVLFLVEYVPVVPGSEGLVLEPAQRLLLNAPELDELRPYALVRLPGDEEAHGGCLAAGRGFIHLSPEGKLEACPFAPFSDSDAGELGLRAALASPLMRAIRERHGELKETKGGCALRDKAGWIASLGVCAREAGAA